MEWPAIYVCLGVGTFFFVMSMLGIKLVFFDHKDSSKEA